MITSLIGFGMFVLTLLLRMVLRSLIKAAFMAVLVGAVLSYFGVVKLPDGLSRFVQQIIGAGLGNAYAQEVVASPLGLTTPATSSAEQPTIPRINWYGESIWQHPDRGFFWYPPAAARKKPAIPKADIATPIPKPQDTPPAEVQQLQALQAYVEERKAVAVMNPSPENVRAYIAAQEITLEKSNKFADAWKQTLWTSPDLDYALKGRGNTPLAIQAYDQQQDLARQATLKDLAKTHGLFFFFRSDCPYCHAQAPVLVAFAKKHGFVVTPISVDNAPLLPEYPKFKPDNTGLATELGVTAVPALFLANPKTKAITPIGFGTMNEPELEERINSVSATTTLATNKYQTSTPSGPASRK